MNIDVAKGDLSHGQHFVVDKFRVLGQCLLKEGVDGEGAISDAEGERLLVEAAILGYE